MLLQKKMSPHCVTSKTEKFMKNTPLCTMYSLICYPSRSALLSQEYFVLLPLLSSTQLFPSNKYRTAHKQFVIGGNEFLIIETDNVLWHLEQCCSALLQARARALTSLLLPPLYTNVNWVGEFPTRGFSKSAFIFKFCFHFQILLIMFFGIWNNAALHSCKRTREP